MNKKIVVPVIIVLVLAIAAGAFLLRGQKPKAKETAIPDAQADVDTVVAIDPAVTVDVKRSTSKDNTVVLSVAGMGSKYTTVAYELSYDSNGIIQGVTSRPVDVGGKDAFVRDDIYLGTCSKNVCKPHTNVKKISLVLEFKTVDGKKSEVSKDFDL